MRPVRYNRGEGILLSMTIIISPGLEEEVQVQARAEGVPVEAYIERLIRENLRITRVDAEAAMIDESDPEFAEIQAAVTEGLEQFERGEGRPARAVFAALRAKHG